MSLEVSALRALAHPLRLRMLSLLTGTPMSAAELARELDITHANASYHLRTLLAADLVVEEGQERVRGGLAKRYRYDVSRPRARGGDESERRLFAEALAGELVRRSADRRAGSKGGTTDAELWVPRAEWREIVRQVDESMARLHEVARPPRSKGTTRVSATVALFEMERNA
ncbi:MAG: helix-turn-helix domain-containing protein [Propionibacteriales bacterium]|nr:helix-turn-helix domain-containing protein [Propionibacteriales bacterium]